MVGTQPNDQKQYLMMLNLSIDSAGPFPDLTVSTEVPAAAFTSKIAYEGTDIDSLVIAGNCKEDFRENRIFMAKVDWTTPVNSIVFAIDIQHNTDRYKICPLKSDYLAIIDLNNNTAVAYQ